MCTIMLKLLTRLGIVTPENRDNEDSEDKWRHVEYLEPKQDLMDRRVQRWTL